MATAQAPLRQVALPPVAALLRPVTLAACALLLVPWLVLVVVNDASLLGAVAGTTTVLAFAAVGFVLAGRLPRHPVPWIFCAAAFLFALIFLADEYARWGLTSGAEPGVGVLLATWSTGWLFAPILGAVALFLPLLFPDGRLPSRRWRPVAWAAAGYVVLATLGNAFAEQETGPTGAPNPYATDGLQPLWTVLRGVAAVLMVVAFAGAVASVVVRLVRARGDERQQMKWFASAAVLLPLAVLLDVWSRQAVIVAFALAPPLLSVAIAVAILRYRLYAIDTILNRTLVYTTLTAVVAVLYVGTVSGLGAVFSQRSDLARSLAATVLVAALFQPVRARLQLAVDRLLYGDRSRPYEAVVRLGKRLETAGTPEVALPGVVETVAQSLRLPYAEIVLLSGAQWVPAATYGVPSGETVAFPLVHQGTTVGKLLVAPRAAGEILSREDRTLLGDLARQVSVAAHAVALTSDLVRSRAELVTAREEERRRLRRDLHDGLGPVLAGVTLGLDVARGCLRTDATAAERLLQELKRETQRAVDDIRHLVYGLRPPALDELGVCRAVREQAARLSSGDGGPSVTVECGTDTLAGLPAAVEVAVYRISVEAVTNVVRHAAARTCVVRFARTAHGVEIEVVDDGRGLPADAPPGVGTAAMRERAQELGGRLALEPAPGGGTVLRAHLPLAAPVRADP